jgi:hypothetical protein
MRKKAWLLVFTLFISFVAYVIYFEFNLEKRRKQNFDLIKGEVVDLSFDVMNGHSIDLTYLMKVDGRNITRSKHVRCDKNPGLNVYEILKGRPLDVACEKGNPENCDLLLRRSDYEEYKLTPSREMVYMLDALEAACWNIE